MLNMPGNVLGLATKEAMSLQPGWQAGHALDVKGPQDTPAELASRSVSVGKR